MVRGSTLLVTPAARVGDRVRFAVLKGDRSIVRRGIVTGPAGHGRACVLTRRGPVVVPVGALTVEGRASADPVSRFELAEARARAGGWAARTGQRGVPGAVLASGEYLR